MAENSGHSGHRQRMRKRFSINQSLDGFADHEIMEMLLFYIFAQKNTNDIAHELIRQFGSVKGVFNASVEQLMQVEGMGENSALAIRFFSRLGDYVVQQKVDNVDVRNFSQAMNYVSTFFAGEKNEKFKVCCIDNSFNISSVANVSEGNSRKVELDYRELTKIVLNNGCSVVIVAHNHPNASNTPSQEDIVLTRNLMQYLRALDITVLDHYIIGNNGTLSMRNCGLIHDAEC